MKASDQCFPGCRLILFTTSCRWLLSLFFSLRHGWNSSEVWLFKWKPLSSTFPGLVLGSLYLTRWSGLTFQCMDKILRCYHLNESLWAVLSWGAVLYVVKVICSSFPVCGSEILKCDLSNVQSSWAILSCVAVLYVVWADRFYLFSQWGNEILKCNRSNDWRVLSSVLSSTYPQL